MAAEKYSVIGFYRYNGVQGKLTGEIEADKRGFFESTIIDDASRVREQIFKGKIHNIKQTTRLEFFKYPKEANLANLAYVLEKPKSDDFSGKYTGKWGALPYKVEFNQDLDLIIARIDMTVCGIGDYAELDLKRV